MERINARLLDVLPDQIDLATIDVSFISLRLVLPRVVRLLTATGQVIALIKPQFEVGKESVGKGGVVRDPRLHRVAIERVLAKAEAVGVSVAGIIRSPIRGPAGNVEYLAWLQFGNGHPSDSHERVTRWLDICLAPEGEPDLVQRGCRAYAHVHGSPAESA
jgi:23S rRNA (cytidine1920-2'-O)/16S rRNA (cytidine1409-2'-O)-methyltransferase